DTTVVNDIDYYYMVQALGATDACFGPVSNCETVTPVPCFTPDAPTGLNASPNGDNQIWLSWSSSDPLATSFNVYRAVGACPQPAYELIATAVATTNYLDAPVSGGLTYSYVVTSKDVTGGCESAPGNCAQAQTNGACFEPPTFAGLQSVTNAAQTTCTLDLGWDSATAYCGGPATYSVYRSTTPGFTPGPANRIAINLTGTAYTDPADLSYGAVYYYVVRATDGGSGVAEDNLVEVSSSPTGPIGIGTWTDDAGDTGAAKLTPTSPWSVATSGGHNGPKVYATGDYGDDTCAAATSEAMHLGTGPQLTFWSKYDIESGYDKGEVQASTDGGSTWVRVPVNYPGYAGNAIDACGLPTGNFFTGTNLTYAQYSASLATWANQDVLIRWLLSSDGYVTESGWWVDDIAITNVEVPTSCDSNPSPFPGPFAKSTPADGATGQPTDGLTLSWTAAAAATGFEVCFDALDNGVCDTSWSNVGSAMSTQVGGLTGGTTYSWQVRAFNSYGSTEADEGTWWTFTTEGLPLPGAFSKIAPANGATGQLNALTLSWGASADATGFEYCVDTTVNGACDGTWTPIGTDTSVYLSGLVAGTSYSWQVRAVNAQGDTEANGGVWWTFTTLPLPGAFSKSAPANGATGQPTSLNLSWGSSTDATSYEYCIDTSNNGACNASWISVGGATGAPLSGLSAATSYFWQVRAVNGQGDTEANGGAWWTFTTQPLPGAFSKTAPANGATGLPTSPTLSWAVSADATSYEYCVDTSNNSACDGSWTTTGSGTSAGLSGLGYATTYYWQVRAVNAQGSTQANGGAWWAFTTEVPMPGAFNKLTPADGATGQLTTLTLSWGASADVGYYEYCIDTADNGVCDGSWIQSGVVTSVQVTDLSEWTAYFWQVRAINGQGSTDADGGAWWWFVTTPYLFGDGFESGDTSPWTTTVP
ncbi:MAG TPA: hypothetical protein PLV66_10545, partial [Thermoanaerobaculales bacterium]|nr:hypothetical protein [Thermoanaerobaculales bacterium]